MVGQRRIARVDARADLGLGVATKVAVLVLGVPFEGAGEVAGEARVAEDLDVALLRLLDDLGHLALQRLAREGAVRVLEPGHRVEVAEARVEVGTVDHGVLVAVRPERRLLLVRRCRGVDLRVLCEDALKHRSGLTRFEVEDEAVIHVLLLHRDQSTVQVFRIDGLLVLGHRYQTRRAMVRVVDEDVVAFGRAEDRALRGLFISS
mmetsp:Transcript_23620/g.61670  ORF Transcript_23620/g.61670 Transcript_23620/m.61670 type:complete len:205 (+) Transcript_23620:417-1031(+)